MTTVQITTRVDTEEKKLFEETTRALGLTPAEAMPEPELREALVYER